MTCKGGNDEECSNSGSAQSSAPAFSYYSISSSASSSRAEGRHMAQYVTCVKSTLKWRSLVLQRRDNKVAKSRKSCKRSIGFPNQREKLVKSC